MWLLIVLLSCASCSSYSSETGGSIELTITNIRNNDGWILVSLFNQSQGFPSDTSRVYRSFILDAESPTLNLNIEDLPPGDYAIAIVHDENQNMELDTNLVGAPVEGYAASGSNRRFSAPRFSSSKFSIRSGSVRLEIKMNYLF